MLRSFANWCGVDYFTGMNAVSSVVAVASPRVAAPAYRAVVQRSSVSSAPPVKSTGSLRQPTGLSAAQNSQPSAPQSLPFGLLESASQPSANNVQASLDYDDLRTALTSGNLTAAQQAYLRMQSDLLMSHPAAAGVATTNDHRLNVAA
jgi:hypothetical protein